MPTVLIVTMIETVMRKRVREKRQRERGREMTSKVRSGDNFGIGSWVWERGREVEGEKTPKIV